MANCLTSLAAVGEISLAGEIRGVTSASQRATEAKRLGYTTLVDAGAVHLREAVRIAFASARDEKVDIPEFYAPSSTASASRRSASSTSCGFACIECGPARSNQTASRPSMFCSRKSRNVGPSYAKNR